MADRSRRDPAASAAALAAEWAALFPGRLLSVVLYGSHARGEADAARSDANLLAVFAEVNASLLEEARRSAARRAQEGVPPPVLLEVAELAAHAKSFAVEFQEMRAHRRVLFGDDVVATVRVRTADVRAQVAAEAHRWVLRLRRAYLADGADAGLLRATLSAAAASGTALLRGLLLSRGKAPDRGGLFDAAGRELGLRSETWARAAALRDGARLSDPDVRFLFGDLMEELERLASVAEGTKPIAPRRHGGHGGNKRRTPGSKR